jgi:hypothetical protein
MEWPLSLCITAVALLTLPSAGHNLPGLLLLATQTVSKDVLLLSFSPPWSSNMHYQSFDLSIVLPDWCVVLETYWLAAGLS